MATALGIDIGGTGIKGAIVDTASGELLTERTKLPTPAGGEPAAIVDTVVALIDRLGGLEDGVPVGVCFPAVVKGGRTLSAANVSKRWIGLEAEALFERALGRDIHFVNDADAAGVAEVRYGAARDRGGVVLLTTLGTGIGTALIHDGVLVPNTEFGHIELHGKDAERQAAYSAMERKRLSWAKWAARLQEYYTTLERLLSPDLFIVGGGVSKNYREFFGHLSLATEIVPAALRNNAGILGAAALAVRG
ncbi:MAG: ROK family protein [Microbacteriaceae bacterium]